MALLASRRHCCLFILDGGVPLCGCFRWLLCLVIVFVVGVSSSSLASPYFWRQLVFVFVVSLLLLSVTVSCHCCCRCHRDVLCKILFYTRLTMHATTMDLQHQVKNVPVELLGVWRSDLVCPSPKEIVNGEVSVGLKGTFSSIYWPTMKTGMFQFRNILDSSTRFTYRRIFFEIHFCWR